MRASGRILSVALGLALVGLTPAGAQIYLDGETPATGSNLGVSPLVTAYGTVTFTGEFRSGPSDPEFIAVGAANNVFDVAGSSPGLAQFDFDFDVNAITFIYGGNGGNITLEARDIGGAVLDSYYQASTGAGEPAGPLTLSGGGGIRTLWWQDTGGSFAPLDNITIDVGVGCTLTGPAGTASGDVQLDLDSVSAVASSVDVDFEFSTDSGATWVTCTAAASSPLPNPALGIPTGPATFLWDSLADGVGTAAVAIGVLARATVDDLTSPAPGVCETAPFDVDNLPPPPTCTLTGPPGVASWAIQLDLDSASVSAPTVEVTFEFSEDGGATWTLCTADASSPLANPASGVPTGPATFVWDSGADGVGVSAVAPGVLGRATLDDLVSPVTGECTTTPFDVDNTAICNGICGDCNLDGIGPGIVDALVAAQIAAGLVTPTLVQGGCCDVNATLAVEIIDALLMAQAAAGLAPTLICP